MKKETNPIVYKTTNLINGKIYVGQDSHNDPRYFGSGRLIKWAIKKYGKENFEKEILEYCEMKELPTREIYWINKLNSHNRKTGYNLITGIQDHFIYSDEQREHLSKVLKGKNKGKRPWLGRKHSEETKLKISCAKKGLPSKRKGCTQIAWNKGLKNIYDKDIILCNKLNQPKRRPVIQYDLNGNFIKEWISGNEIISEYGPGIWPYLYKKINKEKGYRGFIWKFKDDKIK